MKEKFALLTLVLALALASLACGVTLTLPDDAIEIGELQTEVITVQAPEPGTVTDVTIKFGAGELLIAPGGESDLITGSAEYNVDKLKPLVSISGSSVDIEQDPYDFKVGGLPNMKEVENTWQLYFNQEPVTLNIRTGAVNGDLEFGDMAIEELEVLSGAASIDLAFSTPNLANMSQMKFTTGASSVVLSGLSNANFSLMQFEGGVGTYTLDFSGTLVRAATVEINAALSTLKIIVPEGIPATVEVEGSLTSINTSGQWAGSNTFYTMPGEGPGLTIKIKLGGGTLELSN